MFRTLFVLAGFALALSPIANAADAPKAGADAQKAHIEMHQKMADAHKQAAECLKSGKTMDVCRDQFMKATEGLHMGMGPGHGMGHPCMGCKGDCKNCKDCKCKDCPHHGRGKGMGRGPKAPANE